MIYDFIVIGGGVVGCATADRLARYDASVLLLERDDDVAVGASRANSGIVHAGYDCEPGTLKARFNVRGNELMWTLAAQLGVPHLRCGSIVAAGASQLEGLEELLRKAAANGVEAAILDRNRTREAEPHVADRIEYSLYAPSAGVVSPYQLTIALADRAVLNGATVLTEAEVFSVKKSKEFFSVECTKGRFKSKAVIDCAGTESARISALAGAETYETEYRRGDYYVLDNTERKNINTVIFPLPTAAGKGILVAPTADGNVLYGPTSVSTCATDTAVSADSLEEIRKNLPLTYSAPAFGKCIRVYAGIRTIIGHDFIVGESAVLSGFFVAAGICSPGLTSAPAIAEYLAVKAADERGYLLKKDAVIELPRKIKVIELPQDEVNSLVARDPRFGRIVCRCEKITEGEIVQAVHSPVPATTVDAVKRRVRAGMGRCQGGFCATRVMEILSRELGLSMTEIRKGHGHSEIAVMGVKEPEYEI